MTNTSAPAEDYLKEFKARFDQTQVAEGLIKQLGTGEDSSAREELIGYIPFVNDAAKEEALVSQPHEFSNYVPGIRQKVHGRLEDYFDAKGGKIIDALPAGKLERLTFSVRPAKLPKDNKDAKVHNGAIPLWEKHNETAVQNARYVESPEKAVAQGYKEYVANEINQDDSLLFAPEDKKVGPKEKKAREYFKIASLKHAKSSGAFAHAVGITIQKQRAAKFMDYLGKNKYSASTFVRNNVRYAPKEETMGLIASIIASD